MIWARRLQSFGSVPFNHGALLPLLADYRRPNDKIAALLARGDLVQLRRGLYMLGAELRTTPVSLPLVANVLFGPSYVSLDFALSWHALIPEGVVEVSSVTPRRTREFATPLGRFSYSHLPPAVYAVGVRMESTPQGSHFLMASAEKALCDKLLLTRNLNAVSVASMQAYLLEDLRIDSAALAALDVRIIQQCLDAGHKPRQLAALLAALQSLP
ncbi:MAG: hypothetical protein CO065_01555 [Comamonadaceae bacterium CG_4_9_14_0_8_um_filter_57_21]|nr:MAG: hypothetical protein CO065_01555 [Comamonadaceae bacterium CG_4_9_14_0_8_um_filter_57_21]